MKPPGPLITKPNTTVLMRLPPNVKMISQIRPSPVRFPVFMNTGSRLDIPSATHSSSSPAITSDIGPSLLRESPGKLEAMEEDIEKAIFRCRFLAILGVWGSLVGSFLCFIKGCTYVIASYMEYFANSGKAIMLLVEAIGLFLRHFHYLVYFDVYLLGTVMLVFGMGLYELFVSNLDIAKSRSDEKIPYRSNFFGLFTLKERPKWLEIKSVNELKTKIGHVIVMLLLIGLFEKSKKAAIHSPMDLLCFSASILLSSGCLYLLSKLND
ncbi:hypothetical protein L1049_006796 [Liquidambar formosana]|uniref:Uncharacterized protein n=1 Tax=Liquidambar formosana TaxID=63359 RepID=A0AAP0RG77_LIQFO